MFSQFLKTVCANMDHKYLFVHIDKIDQYNAYK